MTATAAALAKLDAAQDAFAPIAQEARNARDALARSKSKANRERYAAACEAFDDALDAVNAAHDAVETAQAVDGALEAQAIAETEALAQPTLF